MESLKQAFQNAMPNADERELLRREYGAEAISKLYQGAVDLEDDPASAFAKSLSAQLMIIRSKESSPPRMYMWKGGEVGYIPITLVSTVFDCQLDTWALVDTGCSPNLAIDEDTAKRMCQNFSNPGVLQGIHKDPVPVLTTDDIKVKVCMLHKSTNKPIDPSGKPIPPVQARLQCMATQKLPSGNSALPDVGDVRADETWPMDVEIALPLQLHPPPHGQAMILGMSGLEKLGLEISIQKSYVYPVQPHKKGFIL